MLREFRVTFGVQYATEQHPVSWVHPDGWLAVVAPNETVAREAVINMVGTQWAFIYDDNDPRRPTLERYPLGQLHLLVCDQDGGES